MTTPSQVPVRYPTGVSTDYKWGPLADYGNHNPFFYQVLSTDCFTTPATDGGFAAVTTGTGAATTAANGDGGIWLLTSSTAGAGTAGALGQKNNFFLPPALYTGSGATSTLYPSKKVFFACRILVTAVATSTVYAGLVPQATVGSLPTDGIFFQLTSAASITLTAYSASTLQWTLTLPATALSGGIAYANTTWIDLAFYMDRLQNVYAFAGYPLFGWTPASAWTGTAFTGTPGPLGAIAAYQTGVSGAWTPTVNGLTPGVILNGTTQTASLDFVMAAKER